MKMKMQMKGKGRFIPDKFVKRSMTRGKEFLFQLLAQIVEVPASQNRQVENGK